MMRWGRRVRQKMGDRCNQVGTSLVESLIAVAIAAVAVTAFLGALSMGAMAVQKGESQVVAESIARSQMESVKAQAYSPSGAYGLVAPVEDGYSVSVVTESTQGRDTNEIQKVTVTVLHNIESVIVEGLKVNR